MRTKELKINGTKVEAILMAGGPGFKIYSTLNYLVLVLGRKINVIDESSVDYKTVISYVNLRFHDEMNKTLIVNEFKSLLSKLGE